MKGVMFNFKMPKVILMKMHLAGKNTMIKFREDWEIPEVKYPNQVQVKTKLGGICTSDLHIMYLDISMFASIMANPENPFPLGHELIGEVSKIGAEVSGLKEGDRVVYLPTPICEAFGFELCSSCRNGNLQNCYCFAGVGDGSEKEKLYGGEGAFGGLGGGGFCEYMVGFEKQYFTIPEIIPDEVAVFTEPFAVGLHAVCRNMPKDDDTVIVIGAGTIGLMTIAAIRALRPKCHVIAIARYPFQADAARTLGADSIIIEKIRDLLYEKVIEITGGRLFKPVIGRKGVFGNTGPDMIFDCIATEESLDDALHLIRSNGKIVIVGQNYSITKKVDWSIQTYKEVDITGSLVYGIERYNGKKLHTFSLALQLLEQKPNLFNGLLTHTYSIDEYKSAFKCVKDKKKNQVIKAAFDYR